MTATLTITLSDEILKALKAEKSITVALESGDRAARPAPAPMTRRARKGGTGRARAAAMATPSDTGPFQAGSLPAKLVTWAAGHKAPFGVADVVGKFRVKRAHASMILTKVVATGHVKRVGRGEYAAA